MRQLTNNRILSIVLVMLAVWFGAFAVQHYVWTGPMRVSPLTSTIDLSMLDLQANYAGVKTYGKPPTATSAAIPFEDASTGEEGSLYIGEPMTVHFGVTDQDATVLENSFTKFELSLKIYEQGSKDAPPEDNVILEIVEGGVGRTSIENYTTLQLGTWDLVLTVDYTTRPLNRTVRDDFEIIIYASEV